MRVAFVYDRLNKIGGAEQVLVAFHELYPQADWFTSVWEPEKASFSRDWKVHTSFLNKIPFLRTRHEWIPFLMPFAFESFDLSAYDLVISIGSAECKGVITRPETLRIDYCLTPTRYLWSHAKEYGASLPALVRPISKRITNTLQAWDLVAATRPDAMISISEHVKNRVKKYYKRDSDVIYPPVDTAKFVANGVRGSDVRDNDYYLVVSRLVSYKNINLIVRAFNGNKKKLVIVGVGGQYRALRRIAGDNITFAGYVSDADLPQYYAGCTAFIQANVEDFGIAMVEALASGKPVIAYNDGGAAEIVSGITGVLYNELSASAINRAIGVFEKRKISVAGCRKQAAQFDKAVWQKQMKERIMEAWTNHKKIYA